LNDVKGGQPCQPAKIEDAGVHEYGMELALEQARKAHSMGEVPVGAVIIKDGVVIGQGHNLKETLKDPTAHAEILAIREAARHQAGWRILDATMYVTLEPCPMCAGAIVMARIPRLVIGTMDPRTGACGSLWNIVCDKRLNHRVELITGIKEDECRKLLEEFFEQLRQGDT
jgi:tRNA(adenine34) deaminase